MKYIIPIDRKTIKPNPRAGETRTYIPGPRQATFHISGKLPEFLIDGENIHLTVIRHTGPNAPEYTGHIIDDETISKCVELGISVTINGDRKNYDHHPIPTHDYEYENIEIKCQSCGHMMRVNDLESDTVFLGDDEYYSSSVCPKCYTLDCCEIEYEPFKSTSK